MPALCLMELVQLFEDESLLLEDPLLGPSHMHLISTVHCSGLNTREARMLVEKGTEKSFILSRIRLFIHVQYLIEPSSFVPLSSQENCESLFLLTSSLSGASKNS